MLLCKTAVAVIIAQHRPGAYWRQPPDLSRQRNLDFQIPKVFSMNNVIPAFFSSSCGVRDRHYHVSCVAHSNYHHIKKNCWRRAQFSQIKESCVDPRNCTTKKSTRPSSSTVAKNWINCRALRVSRQKTEYLCIGEGEADEEVKLQGEKLKRVEEFKCLGSTVQMDGGTGREVQKRIQAGWGTWRKITTVLCDRRVPPKLKGRLYKVMVRPAMLYEIEALAVTKRQESKMEVAEMKMLRFSLGKNKNEQVPDWQQISLCKSLRSPTSRWKLARCIKAQSNRQLNNNGQTATSSCWVLQIRPQKSK